MADPVVELTRLGGVARWGPLRRPAHDAGCAVRCRTEATCERRGRYAVPAADRARVAASRLTGHVSHTSAALHWGWPVKPPRLPARHRSPALDGGRGPPRRGGRPLPRPGGRRDPRPLGDQSGPHVIDCCLDLPFDEDPFEPVLRAIVTSVPGLVARRWLVLRFTWMQVMFEPGLVAETVRAVVDLRRTGRRSGGTRVVRTTKSA